MQNKYKNYLIGAILIVIVFLLVDFFYSFNLEYLFYLELIYSALFFSIIYFIKKIKEQNIKTRLLRELPFFLNSLASDLEKNIPIKLSLENQAKKNTVIGEKINKALDLVLKKGYTLESALEKIGKSSKELERVIYQVNDILQSGTKNKADTFRLLSNNFVEQQSLAIKNYSTKLSFLSLVFVVVSAIVPALFLMFFLVGSNFFEISISSFGVISITLVLFPIIDMFILLFMRANLV
jgi:flagellar protein FlaJ